MIDGRTVMEVDPVSRSAAEVTALWKYVSDRLEKNFRRTVFAAPNTQSAMPSARLTSVATSAVSRAVAAGRNRQAIPAASGTISIVERMGNSIRTGPP